VSRHGHSETESELTQLTIYISTADYSLPDSVNFCLFLESFLFPVHVLPIIPEIIQYWSGMPEVHMTSIGNGYDVHFGTGPGPNLP